MNAITYEIILENLDRELAEIDRSLADIENRRARLEERRAEVVVGISGIKQLQKQMENGKEWP